MFVEMEMKWLSSFPKDTYAVNAKMGDAPITLAPYGYTQLGVHPQTLKVICYIDGDEEQFKTDFITKDVTTTIPEHIDDITGQTIPASSVTETIVKYKELIALPEGYVQSCCNQYLFGNTLTKAAIVAWQYSRDEELALHRKRIDAGEDTDEYLAYTMFVDMIPDEDGYSSEVL